MSDKETVSVTPYVMAGAGVKLACGFAAYSYATMTGNEPGNLSTAVTFLAVGTGIWWYSRAVKRPMRQRELLLFAGGTALVDLLYSAAVIAAPILWAGEDFSMANIDLAMGGDGTGLTSDDLVPLGGLMLFSVLLTAGLSFFLAWLWTRRLSKPAKPLG